MAAGFKNHQKVPKPGGGATPPPTPTPPPLEKTIFTIFILATSYYLGLFSAYTVSHTVPPPPGEKVLRTALLTDDIIDMAKSIFKT